jgi:hypothetical protein
MILILTKKLGIHSLLLINMQEAVMYKVKFYKGDYQARQLAANNDGAVAYVEHHFNSSDSVSADYSLVIVGSNASQTSCNWGRWYSAAICREFNTTDKGIIVGGIEGRGNGNVKYTNMPAVLLEPLFASNPKHAQLIRSDSGQNRLAHILADSIKQFFPNGGLIAFSVGHKYKTSKPHDLGADVVGGGSEADFAELVLQKAETLLTAVTEIKKGRTIKLMQDNELVFEHPIDDDARVVWDETRGILRVNG